jgi:hypothetical protein
MAVSNTYQAIATTTLGSAAASYTFSSIPQTYTDLILIYQTRISTQNSYLDVCAQANGDTGTNYSYTSLTGSGTAAQSHRASNTGSFIFDDNGAPWNAQWAIGRVNFMNYSNTTTYKTAISRTDQGGGTSGGTDAVVNLWRNTAAISSLKIYLNGGSLLLDAGTTLTLYGIAAA